MRKQVLPSSSPRYGIARVLSKRGVCSRTQAAEWVRAGRVRVNGRLIRDPEFPTSQHSDVIDIDGQAIATQAPLYLMLNKPRGLVTTVRDEQGRDTVYACFAGASIDGEPLPWIAPVGRLDKASEGLLLFSNDPHWAAQITNPDTGPHKRYHVQIDCVPDEDLLLALRAGCTVEGEQLRAVSVSKLRSGERHAWLEIVLDEGRNRQIRRLLAAFDIGVRRLLRVAVGDVELGTLAKGQWRVLTRAEVATLRGMR